MTEDEPYKGADEPTRAPLKGPNVISTLGMPPSPDALRAQQAAIRKHLQRRRPEQHPPDEEGPPAHGT